jgi:hypothetical protein
MEIGGIARRGRIKAKAWLWSGQTCGAEQPPPPESTGSDKHNRRLGSRDPAAIRPSSENVKIAKRVNRMGNFFPEFPRRF